MGIFTHVAAYLAVLQPGDAIWRIYLQQGVLLTKGRIVWGTLIQANKQLFHPGMHDCPAMALYSLDPYFDTHPDELMALAHRLFSLKGTRPADRDELHFARVVTDEMDRSMHLPVPLSLTDGRECFASVIMVYRRHLPGRYLSQGLFPLLVRPEMTKVSMIVPSKYWSSDLLRAWGK